MAAIPRLPLFRQRAKELPSSYGDDEVSTTASSPGMQLKDAGVFQSAVPVTPRLPAQRTKSKQDANDVSESSMSPPATPSARSRSKYTVRAQTLKDSDLREAETFPSPPATPSARSRSKHTVRAQTLKDSDLFSSERSRPNYSKAQVGQDVDLMAESMSPPATPSARSRSKHTARAQTLQDWIQQSPPSGAQILVPMERGGAATEDLARSFSKKKRAATIGSSPRTEESLAMRRQLSFVNLSMEELAEAIHEEEHSLDWMPEFWEKVLSLQAPQACKTMALRPLSHWVAIYNKWQAMGNWTPGKAPQFFNAFDAQQILSIPMSRVMDVVKLFDPVGWSKAKVTKAASDYEKIRLPVSPFLAVSILMSSAIAKSQKIRFLLGVFDENDDRCFDENEFIEMIQALLRGIGAMLGLLGLKDGIPSVTRTQFLAQRLFRRIVAFQRKNRAQLEAETESGLGPASVPVQVVEDWILGESDDALNLPFALFVKRFSVGVEDEDPEAFEDESRKFQLSHTVPVDLPLETSASLDGTFLNRYEVIVVQRLFKHCLSTGNFDILHADAEAAVGHIDKKFWIERLNRGLLWMEESRGFGKTVLSNLFKSVCPKATGRHLRMFHNWVKEYDQLENLRREANLTRQQLQICTTYCSKPWLPPEIRRDLLADHQIRAPHLTVEEYLQASSPSEFRPFPGHPAVDEVVLELLAKQLATEEEKIQQKQRLYLPNPPPPDLKQEVVRRRVDPKKWAKWNEAFDRLGLQNDSGTKDEVLQTRMIPPENVDFLLRLCSSGDRFTRWRFLETLSSLSNVRLPRPKEPPLAWPDVEA